MNEIQTRTATLARFQDGIARALLAPESEAADPPDVAELVLQPGFAVYRNTVMKGCIDALQSNYPAVARLVGEEWFRAAAAIYVRTNLPRHSSLFDYGENFPAFLFEFLPAKELPYLSSVARLDRYWSESHTTRDQTPVDPATLAGLAPGELARAVLIPHVSARWAWFADQPAYSIWRCNREDGREAGIAAIEWRAEGALVLRPRDTVEWIALDAAGCAFLGACAAGGCLAEAAAAAVAVDSKANLTGLMATLLAAGAFGQLILPREAQRRKLP